jgi:YVTN family beta-propeller protein
MRLRTHTSVILSAILLLSVSAFAQQVIATIPVGSLPNAVAVNPVTNRTYVADYLGNAITVIDGTTNLTTSIPANAPVALAVNPITNMIYVVNYGDDTISAINGATNTVTAVIAAGVNPWAIAINPVTNQIFVANYDDSTVMQINGNNNVSWKIPVGFNPTALAVNSVTNKVWVANNGDGTVTVLDGTSNETDTVSAGSGPCGVAVNLVTNFAYVLNCDSSTVTAIDGTTYNTYSSTTGNSPSAIAINPASNQIYVPNFQDDSVTVINGATFGTTTVPLIPGSGPFAVAVNPFSNQIYVMNAYANTATWIDGVSNATTTLAVGATPYAVAINPVTDKIYVADSYSNDVKVIDGSTMGFGSASTGSNPVALDLDPTTNLLYVANSGDGTVSVIDGSTGMLYATVPADSAPSAIVVDPTKNKIYVANRGGNDVTVIDGNSNTSIKIAADRGPVAIAVNPATQQVYVANHDSNDVTIINASTNTTTTTLADMQPCAIGINTSINQVYVANCGGSTVTEIDGFRKTAVSIAVGSNPSAIVVNPAANLVYVANAGSNSVTIIDAVTFLTTQVQVGNQPSALAINTVTNQIYVANTGSQSVTVIDGNTNTVKLTLQLGITPGALAVNQASNKVYVTSPNGSNVIVIDVATNTLSTVPAGSGLGALAVNPVSDAIYALNSQNNTVVGIRESTRALQGYRVLPQPMSGNISNSLPTFTLLATDENNNPIYPIAAYWQMDTTQGTWTPAGQHYSSTFYITVPAALPIGPHVLYTYPAQGDVSNPGIDVGTPRVGDIGAYLFNVVSTNQWLSQTINFPNPGGQTYGAAPITLRAIASSGLQVAYRVISGPATIAGSMLTITGAGTVVVLADQPGGGRWAPADPVQVSFIVSPAVLTVTADSQTMPYGGPLPMLTASYSGFVNGDGVSVLSGSPSLTTTANNNSAPGTYPITAAQGTLQAANYTFQFVNGVLTVNPAILTVTANSFTITYGQNTPTLTYTITGFLGSDNQSNSTTGQPSLTTTAPSVPPAGNYPITITQGSLTSTKYTFVFVNGKLTVNPAMLTVTADNKSMSYGGTVPTFTYTITGFVNGDMQNSATSGTPNLSTMPLPPVPPSQAIAITQGTLTAANYTFQFVNGALTVSPAVLTVTANSFTITYGQNTPTLTYVLSGFVNGDNQGNSTSGQPNLTTTAPPVPPAGSYPITATQGSLTSSKYTFVFVNGSLAVNQAVLTVTADNKTMPYGGPLPQFTASYSGFVNGDGLGVLSGSPSLTTTADNNSAPGPYPITATQGSLQAANYTFQFVNGALTVSPGVLTVTANSFTITYGQSTPTLTYTITGFVGADNQGNSTAGQPNLSTTAISSPPVGSYPITVTQGGLTSSKYTFVFVNGNLTVCKAVLTVTADNKSMSYGGTVPTFTYTMTGFVNSDTQGSATSGSPNLSTMPLPPAPPSQAITVSQGTLQATNYTFQFVNGALTVNPAVLTVTANGFTITYGQNTPTLTYAMTGFLGTDNQSNSTSGQPSLTTTAPQVPPAGNYPITIAQGSLTSSKYSFVFVNGSLTVNQAVLIVTADNKTMPFGGPLPPLTASYSGFVNGDGVGVLSGSPSLTTTATNNSAPGNYPINAAQGTLSAQNYTFTFVSGILTVTLANAVITTPAKGSQFGSSTVTIGWSKQSQATSYRLYVGSTPGAYDIAALLTPNLSLSVANIPTDGRTIYVTLFGNGTGSYVLQDTATYTAVNIVKAAITAPTKGSGLGGSTATFTWSAETGGNPPVSTYTLYVGSTPGAYDIAAFQTPNLTFTVSNIPTDGRTLYVTLSGNAGGVRLQQDTATYTAFSPAAITTPSKGSTLSGYVVTFGWTAETGATSYQLYIGSSPGASDITSVTTSSMNATVSNLPVDGRKVYVTLYGNGGGVMKVQDTATYTAGNITKAVITTPSKGSTLSGYVVTFGWTAETGATSYQVYVGSSPGASDIASVTTSSLTTTVSNLPADGRTVYVTLYGNGGGLLLVQDTATYTAAKITKAVITTPSKGSTLSGSVATFGWTAETGATSYQLCLGSSAGASDIALVTTSSLSSTVSNLPVDGRTIYVTLYGNGGGLLLVQDTATYTAASISVITTPAKGSQLGGSTVTFGWTAQLGATSYRLYVGSTTGGYDIAALLTPNLSLPVMNIPTDGRAIYVTLFGNAGGSYKQQDTATYTAVNIVKAVITAPAKGSQLSGGTATFTWSAEIGGNPAVSTYTLYVGSAPGAYDIAALQTPNLSLTVSNIPTDGRTLYVTLSGNAGGVRTQQDTATYTAFKK